MSNVDVDVKVVTQGFAHWYCSIYRHCHKTALNLKKNCIPFDGLPSSPPSTSLYVCGEIGATPMMDAENIYNGLRTLTVCVMAAGQHIAVRGR